MSTPETYVNIGGQSVGGSLAPADRDKKQAIDAASTEAEIRAVLDTLV